MSIETVVEELYGDTKDDSWKKEEVSRIKAEQGVSYMDEPILNEQLEGFNVENSFDSQ